MVKRRGRLPSTTAASRRAARCVSALGRVASPPRLRDAVAGSTASPRSTRSAAACASRPWWRPAGRHRRRRAGARARPGAAHGKGSPGRPGAGCPPRRGRAGLGPEVGGGGGAIAFGQDRRRQASGPAGGGPPNGSARRRALRAGVGGWRGGVHGEGPGRPPPWRPPWRRAARTGRLAPPARGARCRRARAGTPRRWRRRGTTGAPPPTRCPGAAGTSPRAAVARPRARVRVTGSTRPACHCSARPRLDPAGAPPHPLGRRGPRAGGGPLDGLPVAPEGSGSGGACWCGRRSPPTAHRSPRRPGQGPVTTRPPVEEERAVDPRRGRSSSPGGRAVVTTSSMACRSASSTAAVRPGREDRGPGERPATVQPPLGRRRRRRRRRRCPVRSAPTTPVGAPAGRASPRAPRSGAANLPGGDRQQHAVDRAAPRQGVGHEATVARDVDEGGRAPDGRSVQAGRGRW